MNHKTTQSAPVTINAGEFQNLHGQHYQRLLGSMTRVTRNAATAEDVTAAAFAKAYENRTALRSPQSFYGWVYTIALNNFRHEYRIVADGDHVQNLERNEFRTKLRVALRRMPAMHRKILVDHVVNHVPVKRLATRYRIPLGTALSRIARGKALLRQAWGT